MPESLTLCLRLEEVERVPPGMHTSRSSQDLMLQLGPHQFLLGSILNITDEPRDSATDSCTITF